MTHLYQRPYQKFVGRIGDEYYFVEYVFNSILHDKPFHGAVGLVFRSVSNAEATDCLNSNHIEAILDALDEDEGLTVNDIPSDEWPTLIWDFSGEEWWGDLRELLGTNEAETPYFDCVGGGRIFSTHMELEEIWDDNLWDIVQAFEG